jgi:hypothetical protein
LKQALLAYIRPVSNVVNLDLPKPHLPIFGNHCQKSNDLKFRQTIARSFALPSQSMIHKQFPSRDGNATILPPLHYHRQKNIARVSVA